MNSYRTSALLGIIFLCGCAPEPIASATYDTPNGKRELYAFPPPEIKNTNDLSEVTKVNIVFCRWGGDKKVISVLLHCNFDTAPHEQLNYRRPTFLSMKARWKKVAGQKYEMTGLKLKTPSSEIRIVDERKSCSRNNCGLEITKLKFPSSTKDSLDFSFAINTKVSENNGKEKYNTKIAFEGEAPRTPGR